MIDSIDAVNHYLSQGSFCVLDDDSFIFAARTMYVPGAFGVSQDSYFDFNLIKFSSANRSIQWVTSVDFENSSDNEMSIYISGSNLYFLMSSNINDYCLGILSTVDGKIGSNMWMNLPSNQKISQKLDFILIDQKWIFATFPGTINISSKNLVIFDSGNM